MFVTENMAPCIIFFDDWTPCGFPNRAKLGTLGVMDRWGLSQILGSKTEGVDIVLVFLPLRFLPLLVL